MLAWLLMLDKVERMRSWDARHGCYDSWYSWISCLIMTLSTVGASCRHYHYMHTWNSSHVHQAVRMSYNSQQYTISNPYYEDSKREHSESMSTWASWAHEHRERARWEMGVWGLRAWALWEHEHCECMSTWALWAHEHRECARWEMEVETREVNVPKMGRCRIWTSCHVMLSLFSHAGFWDRVEFYNHSTLQYSLISYPKVISI